MANWYYCLDHQAVEGTVGCRPRNRLGPYNTEEEAAPGAGEGRRAQRRVGQRPGWNAEGSDN